MFNFDGDLKLIFLEEAQSLLDDSEAAFIALDSGDHSPELVDKIFRLAHNFKSSAKTVGLQALSDFGHVFEDVLTKIKNGTLKPDKNVCTILLQTLDHFKAYVNGLKEDLNYQHDITEIMAKLNGLRGESPPSAAESPSEEVSTSSSPHSSETTEASAPEAVPPPTEMQASVETVTQPTGQAPTTATAPPASPKSPKSKNLEEENLKVNRVKLDTLLNLIGELVVNQSMVAGYRDQGTLNSDESVYTITAMEKIVYEIQNISMALRMTPMSPLFQKMKRIARDASSNLGKEIQFISEGEHVELDKIVLEKISDPLTHLVRNAVDHGIETSEERAFTTKNLVATITMTAQQKEDRIIVVLSDDGRGMNPTKLKNKAIEKGLIQATDVLTDEEAYALIFKPGFSTKEQVTDMSGRGVGMDVVRTAIESLKGSIQIQTQLGHGSQFIISLPLSMSIITGMVIGVDKKKYVVPISQLVETVDLSHFRVETSTGTGRMFNLRGDVIPIYSLGSILHSQEVEFQPKNYRPGLITSFRDKKYSFEIDQIYGQQQIVIKKLGSEMQALPGIAAGAILNTGEPGLVLDLADFIDRGGVHAA